MPVVLPDLTKPVDLVGLETRDRHGHQEAVCPGCGAWVRLGAFYKGNRKVILQIPHIPRCDHFETILATGALR